MPIPIEPIKIRRVRLKAVTGTFYADGKIAEVGKIYEMDFSEGETLAHAGKATILGDAEPRILPLGKPRW